MIFRFFNLMAALAAITAVVSCSSSKTATASGSQDFPTLKNDGKIAIVAHRGFWKCEQGGFSQNSIASLKAAQDAGLWGSECDIHITKDDKIIVNHDNDIDSLKISEHTFAELSGHLLPNGEKRPSLDDYLVQAAKCPTTVLVIEFKKQKDLSREDLLIKGTVKALKKHGLFDPKRVVFISFSNHICDVVAKKYPQFTNQYLNGDITPQTLSERKINGIDYHFNVLGKHREYVNDAHALGMSVNVWTVNKEEDLKSMIDLGVDQITTNEPLDTRILLGDREYR